MITTTEFEIIETSKLIPYQNNARTHSQEQILKLEKQIKKTETAMWKEQQPKKKFELHTRLREYQQKLEDLKHGTS